MGTLSRLTEHSLTCSFKWSEGTDPNKYLVIAQAAESREFKVLMRSKVFASNKTVTVHSDKPVYGSILYIRLSLIPINDLSKQGPWISLLDGYNVTSSCTNDEYLNDTALMVKDWTCDPCPMGAVCSGEITYAGVKGKF